MMHKKTTTTSSGQRLLVWDVLKESENSGRMELVIACCQIREVRYLKNTLRQFTYHELLIIFAGLTNEK